MNTAFAQGMLAWLLTYAVHSTVLLGGAWIVLRRGRIAPAVADVVWKAALVGGILTSTTQAALGLRPAGSLSMARSSSIAMPATPVTSADRVAEESSVPAAIPLTPGTESLPSGTGGSVSFASIVAFGWIALALTLVLWYLGRRLVLVGRIGDRRPVSDRTVSGLLDTLRRESGVASPVRLTVSATISSPVALGSWEICLPAAALVELEPAQQRAMLAHELAHLVRRDALWLSLGCLIERAFFFQPLNRFALRGLQESAEFLADEWAVRHSGGVQLARALVKVAEWIQASPLGVPVAGFAEERSQLTARVSRLLESGRTFAPRSRPGVLGLSAVTLVLTAAFAPGVAGRAVAPAQGTGGPTGEPLGPISSLTSLSMSDSPVSVAADTAIVRAVMARLRDEDTDVRRAAASALGRMKHPMAVEALVAALDDVVLEVRRAALEALSEFERGRVPSPPIRRLLSSEDTEMRSQAVRLLGELRDRAAIPAIVQLLVDPQEEVRYSALQSLDELDAPIGDDLITRALEDRSAEIREAAAGLAGDRQVVATVPSLIKLLDDRSGSVRERAASALAEMRTEASHAALKRALTHKDPSVRRIAVEYFGEELDP